MECEGFSELLKTADDFNVELENEDIVELELSEDNEYASLIYNKNTKEYSIEYLDMDELEEYEIPIDVETFDEFEINRIKVTKELVDKFKSFIDENAI